MTALKSTENWSEKDMAYSLLSKIILCVVLLYVFIVFGSSKIIKDKTPGDTSTSSGGFGSKSSLDNLTSDMLTNYGSSVRPFCTGENTVQVTVDMAIRQLIKLDEPAQTVEFNMWMRLGWVDCHLQWDPDDYDGIKSVVLPIDKIWKPDITLYNSISEEFYGFEKFRANINYDGNVSYNFPTKIESLCPIKVGKFPFDSQVCVFAFGSWSYHGFELNVSSKINKADLSSMNENVEWIIDKAPAVRHELYYGCCPEPYPDVTFYVHLTRKPDYYITNIVIPSIVVTLIGTLGFILPVDSGEKVGLELTVMLAMSVFQLLIADNLPPSADEIPWISIFFSLTLLLSGGASCWQVLVLNIHHRGESPMPRWLKFYILKPLGMITGVVLPRSTTPEDQHASNKKPDKVISRLFQNLNENRKARDAETGSTITHATNEQGIDHSQYWIKLAIILDRIGLFTYCFSFLGGCAYIFIGIKQH